MTYRTIATCLLVVLALGLLASMEPYNVWLFTLTGIVAVSALWVGLRHSRRWGVLWALFGMLPLAAISALTIGLPVPMRGWERGLDWVSATPFILLFYTFFQPWLFLVLVAVVVVIVKRGRRSSTANPIVDFLSGQHDDGSGD